MTKASRKQSMMSIGELARDVGVSTATVRHYDKLGLIRSERHTRYARRKYPTIERAVLHNALRAKLLGLSLTEIKELVSIGRLEKAKMKTKVIERSIELLLHRLRELEVQKEEVDKAYTLVTDEIVRLKDLLQREREMRG